METIVLFFLLFFGLLFGFVACKLTCKKGVSSAELRARVARV